jgi:hypothetical protein
MGIAPPCGAARATRLATSLVAHDGSKQALTDRVAKRQLSPVWVGEAARTRYR